MFKEINDRCNKLLSAPPFTTLSAQHATGVGLGLRVLQCATWRQNKT